MSGGFECIAWHAAQHGHLERLRYAHEQDATLCDDSLAFWAAGHGQLECVRFVHAHGAPLDGGRTPRAFGVGEDNWDCFRYISLHLPSWPDMPPAMAAWQSRVRATAAAVLRIVRRNRATAAAITIQRRWLDRHYAPGGRGHALSLARCAQLGALRQAGGHASGCHLTAAPHYRPR